MENKFRTKEENQQELMYKLSLYEQQMQQIQQQLDAVENAIVEISNLNVGLDELVGSERKEIFAPIGRGVFAKAKLISEELTVDIGGKNFVQKSIPETKKLIEEQIKKLEEVKKELQENLENLNEELTKTFMDAQQNQEDNSQHKHEHKCGDDCECGKKEKE